MSPLNNWIGGVSGIVSPNFVVFVSTLSRLFCVCGSCCGNLQPYSPSQTLLLDLSGPVGGEGKATRRELRGRKGRDRKRRNGLSPSKKIHN